MEQRHLAQVLTYLVLQMKMGSKLSSLIWLCY